MTHASKVRLYLVVLWTLASSALATGYVFLVASDRLVVTDRHSWVFEHVLSEEQFAILYLIIGATISASIVIRELRWFGLALFSLMRLFWAVVPIVRTLLNDVGQGNLHGAFSAFALFIVLALLSHWSYEMYNMPKKRLKKYDTSIQV